MCILLRYIKYVLAKYSVLLKQNKNLIACHIFSTHLCKHQSHYYDNPNNRVEREHKYLLPIYVLM